MAIMAIFVITVGLAGGFFGRLVHYLFPAVTAPPGACSIVGMGAVVAATTHGLLSAILILFEMIGCYTGYFFSLGKTLAPWGITVTFGLGVPQFS